MSLIIYYGSMKLYEEITTTFSTQVIQSSVSSLHSQGDKHGKLKPYQKMWNNVLIHNFISEFSVKD